MIVELVRAGLRSAPAEGVAARLERLGRERRVAVDEAVARSPAWRRPLLRRLASLVERYMPLREAPKHYAMYVFQRMRAAALELGSRLSSRGRLDRQDDALFLEWEELRRLLDGATWDARSLVAERRTRDARHRSLKPPHHLRSDGIPVDEPAPKREDAALLRGLGASHGRASGHARVLREPDPAAMADGDILVVAFADPGWTPLFPRAAAVVMEVGGLMCHAAVVARELGIPAVFGASDATLRIPDGAVVHVDGDRGTVSLEAGEARGASPPSGPRTKMAGLRHIDPEEIP
jgi:pyruvate,water dikinase